MTKRDTSAQSFHDLQDSGKLGELQLAVYAVVRELGPITQGECWSQHFPTKQRHTIAPRFAELERRGLIRPGNKRPCKYSGRVAYTWEAADEYTPRPHRVKCDACKGKGYVTLGHNTHVPPPDQF